MTDVPQLPQRLWLDQAFQPWRVWTLEMPDLQPYVRADLVVPRATLDEAVEVLRRMRNVMPPSGLDPDVDAALRKHDAFIEKHGRGA